MIAECVWCGIHGSYYSPSRYGMVCKYCEEEYAQGFLKGYAEGSFVACKKYLKHVSRLVEKDCPYNRGYTDGYREGFDDHIYF